MLLETALLATLLSYLLADRLRRTKALKTAPVRGRT
jgi:hypothetical protein